MMIKQVFISSVLGFLFLVNSSLIFGQSIDRKYTNYEIQDNKINIYVTDGTYEIIPFSDQIVHTTFLPNKLLQKPFTYAVTVEPNGLQFKVSETKEKIILASDGINIQVYKNPFQIKYYYKGEQVIAEAQGYYQNDSTHTMQLGITPNEVLYGAGERVLGMNRRGYKLELYNKAHYGYETHSELMNYTLPVFISSNKYAVLFDNASKGWLDLDSQKNNTITYEATSGTINYYVIVGNDWYNLTEQYTALTGRQPLPPRWAFGNFSSRFGYHSQTETENTVNKFLEDSIPLDAIIIDIYWFGQGIFGHMGNLDWYRDSFPNPSKMISDFKKKGIKTILVTEPFILTTSKRWNEAVEKQVICTDTLGTPFTYDFYFGNTGLVDVFKPEAKEWFWDIYKNLNNQGIGGWWGDLGEPEVHPKSLQHINGSADEVHNAYGHEWAKLIYEGYQNDFPNTRPFILMRSGYAGSQRYGMIPWTGDVSRSWGGLVPQVEIALQMGMQGMAYTHSDLGGFAGGDSIDNELYIRWLQYGVFQPIYRPHAQEQIASEPVFQNDTTKQHAKNAIELRYKLLPYIYSLAYKNSQTGRPLMTPLFFDEPENADLLTYDEAYMWGDAFLVAPVKKAGQKNKEIYLPKNSEWFDFYTGQKYEGGHKINTTLNINSIPVIVKGGAFIPMVPNAQNTSKYSLANFEMHYYYSASQKQSSYLLYNDDGETPTTNNIDKEFYAFNYLQKNNSLIFEINKTIEGKAICSQNNITFIIHQINAKPTSISVNNQYVDGNDFAYDPINKTLKFSFNLPSNKCIINIAL